MNTPTQHTRDSLFEAIMLMDKSEPETTAYIFARSAELAAKAAPPTELPNGNALWLAKQLRDHALSGIQGEMMHAAANVIDQLFDECRKWRAANFARRVDIEAAAKAAPERMDKEALDKTLCDQFARRVPVEQALSEIANGKRDLPTREECGQWAARIGVPNEYNPGAADAK